MEKPVVTRIGFIKPTKEFKTVEGEVSWENGELKSVKLSSSQNAHLYLNPSDFVAMRDLWQEIVTQVNNPPVGCEPV